MTKKEHELDKTPQTEFAKKRCDECINKCVLLNLKGKCKAWTPKEK